MEFKHISVLLGESVDALNVESGKIYVDATLGGGGHSFEIAKKMGSGLLIGIDRDADAILASKQRLKDFDFIKYVHSNYTEILDILKNEGIDKIDGAIMDLGVSSYQLDNSERGFSYMEDAPLDMRMNRDNPFSAYTLVNTYSKDKLTKIFYEYGEERFSKRIAERIVEKREVKPIETTLELVDIIKKAIGEKNIKKGSHPAKRVFQAIRIEVNNELEPLKKAVEDFFESLNKGARLCIITFHSLEDRIVKKAFNSFTKGCTCPKDFPICVCGNVPKGKVINSKPIIATNEELENNKRAKSAKLRIIEKL